MARSSPPPEALADLLAAQLPRDVPFTFYHYSTPPTRCPALFSAPPHAQAERTYCESHTLAASISAPEELLVLALEVLVYTTTRLTTVFVSKADSTGCIAQLKSPRSQSGSPLKAICGTFVSWLARHRQRPGKKLVVSLFARAQDQYLFPGSISNKDKHVLDDRGLVRWWCKVLDPLLQEYAPEEEQKPLAGRLAAACDSAGDGALATTTKKSTAKGYLLIPGFESYDTLRYIPSSPSPPVPRRWATTHPLLQIAPCPAAPPRCLVPHFPDDPKSRFLDELDEELPDRGSDALTKEGGTPSRSNGQWKSVKTLDQFWEFMAFRQECSSGRIVGFLWIVITPPEPAIPEEDGEEPSQAASTVSETSPARKSGSGGFTDSKQQKKGAKKKANSHRKKVNTEYGPIPLILPKIKSMSSTSSMPAGSPGLKQMPPETSPYYKWPIASRGSICFSTKNYHRAHEVLIQQNFANRNSAARSTKRWKDEVAVLGGVEKWGWTVVGKKETAAVDSSAADGATPVMVVGSRKKRKPEGSVDVEATRAETKTDGVQVLNEGLVRKKAKAENR